VSRLESEVDFLRAELVHKDQVIATLSTALSQRPLALPAPSPAPPATAAGSGPVRNARWKFWRWFWVAPA
jgi:hypothetical protein